MRVRGGQEPHENYHMATIVQIQGNEVQEQVSGYQNNEEKK